MFATPVLSLLMNKKKSNRKSTSPPKAGCVLCLCVIIVIHFKTRILIRLSPDVKVFAFQLLGMLILQDVALHMETELCPAGADVNVLRAE